MEADNLARQTEEIEVLCSIYGDDWKTEIKSSRCHSTTITEGKNQVNLSVTLPVDYPSNSPPIYELSAPWMQRKAKENLHVELNQIYLDNAGEPVIYQWIEKIREVLQNINQEEIDRRTKIDKLREQKVEKLHVKCPPISHGEVITDRKSSFQGHAAEVHSMEEIQTVLHTLKQNKKISNAFHNMYAYRIDAGRGVVYQDCDDDGEAHAGGRLLHLLQILDQKAAIVIVSRWYGGIQLGPDRFRHINNAARSALVLAGLLDN